MTDEPETPSEEFMSALVTEHFALQSARGTLTAESASRAALYLASVTGSLIALGFVANNRAAVLPFAVAIIPALLILGEFTYWRLVMNGVEDLHHSYEIQAIRAYYRRFVPAGLTFFAKSALWKSAPPPDNSWGQRPGILASFSRPRAWSQPSTALSPGRGPHLPRKRGRRHRRASQSASLRWSQWSCS